MSTAIIDVAMATGAVLDYLAGRASGFSEREITIEPAIYQPTKRIAVIYIDNGIVHGPLFCGERGANAVRWHPTSNPKQAHHLIEIARITVGPWDTSPAMAHCGTHNDVSSANPRMVGPDLLTAAMRCYVRSRLGLAVSVPPHIMRSL